MRKQILNEEQEKWVGKHYPFHTNEVLAKMILKKFQVVIRPDALNNYADRNSWKKASSHISALRKKQAMTTNFIRWGTRK